MKEINLWSPESIKIENIILFIKFIYYQRYYGGHLEQKDTKIPKEIILGDLTKYL